MSDSDERLRIEHDLAILRSRYALMQKWAIITKWFVIACCPVLAAIVVYALIAAEPLEAALVVFLVSILVTIMIVLRHVRWIDAISGPPRGFSASPGISEARAIESMIAEREQRLRELGPA